MQHAPKSKRALSELEHELRESGLEKPIESDNKGFLLLQKMMSKSSSVGGVINDMDSKNNESVSLTISSSVSDMHSVSTSTSFSTSSNKLLTNLVSERVPIRLDLKSGRAGLGHETTKRLKQSSNKLEDIDRLFRLNEADFRQHQRQTKFAALAKKDYFTCQQVCANLEQKQHNNNNNSSHLPVKEWYWPSSLVESFKNNINNKDEKIDHNEKDNGYKNLDKNDEEDKDVEDNTDYIERLKELNQYLIHQHHYCVWCGIQYDSVQDLKKNCPGDTRDEH